MKRRRIITAVLAAACLVMAGVTLKQFSAPFVAPAAAQSGPADAAPDFGALKPASAPVRKAAAAAIRAQLAAFAKDDYQTAVKYQSSNLKRNFPSVAQFRQMMTSTYPEFAHSKNVRFGDMRADAAGKHVMAQVTLTGQDGVTLRAVYLMVREAGGYKVDGVAGGGRVPLHAAPGGSVDA